jgi:phosphoenolpyruvate synthase/pyruvate phosphate dikinase
VEKTGYIRWFGEIDHLKIGLSIGVQRMVRSDLASSGVMFSIDTEPAHRTSC